MKLAPVEIDKQLRGTGAMIIFVNHDSFIIEAPDGSRKEVHAIVMDAVLKAGKIISQSLSLRVDQKQPWLSCWHHGQGEAAFERFVGEAEEEMREFGTSKQAAP